MEISQGLQYLHSREYMHRDIKPENILLDKDFHARICDFGTTKIQDLMITRTEIGTPMYMDPAVSEGKYTNKCDIYSLGLVFYFILAGHGLFDKCQTKGQLSRAREELFGNPEKLLKDMPVEKEIKDIVKNCLQKSELSRLDISQIVEKLKTYIGKLSERKKHQEIKSTFMCTEENQIPDQVTQQLIGLIAVKPEFQKKEVIEGFKKQIL